MGLAPCVPAKLVRTYFSFDHGDTCGLRWKWRTACGAAKNGLKLGLCGAGSYSIFKERVFLVN